MPSRGPHTTTFDASPGPAMAIDGADALLLVAVVVVVVGVVGEVVVVVAVAVVKS